MYEIEAVVFDTETTGKDPRGAAIVEIAALKVTATERSGSIEEIFVSRMNPGPDAVMEEGAQKTHGISLLSLVDERRTADVLDDFFSFCGNPERVIAHNLHYDITILSGEMCLEEGHHYGEMFCKDPLPVMICTLQLARRLIDPREVINYQLEQLVNYFEIPVTNAHSAAGDVEMTLRLYEKLMELFEKEKLSISFDEWIQEPIELPLMILGKEWKGVRMQNVDSDFLHWILRKFDRTHGNKDLLFTCEKEIERRAS